MLLYLVVRYLSLINILATYATYKTWPVNAYVQKLNVIGTMFIYKDLKD